MSENINGVALMLGIAQSRGLELDVDENGELLIHPSPQADSVTVHHLHELKLWIIPVLLLKKVLAECHGGMLLDRLQSKSGLGDDDFEFALRTLIEEREVTCSDAGVWVLREEVN